MTGPLHRDGIGRVFRFLVTKFDAIQEGKTNT